MEVEPPYLDNNRIVLRCRIKKRSDEYLQALSEPKQLLQNLNLDGRLKRHCFAASGWSFLLLFL